MYGKKFTRFCQVLKRCTQKIIFSASRCIYILALDNGHGQSMKPALCLLYRHTFVRYGAQPSDADFSQACPLVDGKRIANASNLVTAQSPRCAAITRVQFDNSPARQNFFFPIFNTSSTCCIPVGTWCVINKKGSPYSITKRTVPELIPVLGSQPAGDVSHKPGARLPLLSARPAVKRAATNFAAW